MTPSFSLPTMRVGRQGAVDLNTKFNPGPGAYEPKLNTG
jgi:hypothetical protein